MKHILITGGGSGLGAHLALGFANLGHRVSIIDQNEDALVLVAMQNPRIFVEKAHLSQPLNLAFERCVKHHGRVGVMIAIANETLTQNFNEIAF